MSPSISPWRWTAQRSWTLSDEIISFDLAVSTRVDHVGDVTTTRAADWDIVRTAAVDLELPRTVTLEVEL